MNSSECFEIAIENVCKMARTFLSIEDIKECLHKMIYKLSAEENKITCTGCLEEQPNQLAHMDIGGCMYDTDSDIV